MYANCSRILLPSGLLLLLVCLLLVHLTHARPAGTVGWEVID